MIEIKSSLVITFTEKDAQDFKNLINSYYYSGNMIDAELVTRLFKALQTGKDPNESKP